MPPFSFDLVRAYRVEVATGVVLYALAELVWLRVRRRRVHEPRELLANLSIYVVETGLRLGTWPARLALFMLAHAASPLRLPSNALTACVCYLGVDVILYFWHRALHESALGWALHSVHHTGRAFNVSLGVRINWLQRSIDDVVYLPLALLGFDPLLVLAMVACNRLSQYWVHTEMIGKLPWLDAWLNTPSNHRVHHAAQSGGARANYGSNLMLWDRLFGTYRREQGAIGYGTDAGELGTNPWRIQFAGLIEYARRRTDR
jgi:sterol desaturase/sphingolipid hydroxylase (fatty acid hydroxylase superfamily)